MADTEYVKLISAEGHEFIIDRNAAVVSNTIKSMLQGAGTYTETSQGEIRFPEITTRTLEKTIQYFYYKLKYTNNKEGHLPEFKIEPEHALELLMAANYLDT
mmetsp:Transcript_15248/g.39646  ORF Transcript_15248/g.39646 Transcript_15248/m.39646 type:complete len:102 (+) Transcript_15248:59-364(+)